jgi:hypothetical protein
MRVVLRDDNRKLIGRIDVNASLRPTRVSVPAAPASGGNGDAAESANREVFLNWDTALDDAGQLRKCIVCSCTDLYTEKAFPIVTGAVVAMAFIGAAMGAAGLADTPPVLIGMGIVLVLDVAILFFSRRRLVCYQCRTTYRELSIARYHRPWDRSIAEKHRLQNPQRLASPALNPQRAARNPEATADRIVLPTVTRTAPVAADKGYFA